MKPSKVHESEDTSKVSYATPVLKDTKAQTEQRLRNRAATAEWQFSSEIRACFLTRSRMRCERGHDSRSDRARADRASYRDPFGDYPRDHVAGGSARTASGWPNVKRYRSNPWGCNPL